MKIVIKLSATGFCRWQQVLIDRLRLAGHEPGLTYVPGAPGGGIAGLCVALEPRRFGAGLAYRAPAPEAVAIADSALVIDISGLANDDPDALAIGLGADATLASLPAVLVAGQQPHLVARLGGRAVAEAFPMVRDRLWLARGMEDVLARAMTLIEACVRDFAAVQLTPIAVADDLPRPGGFVGRYLPGLAAGVASRALARRTHHGFYWRTGFRRAQSPGVAETGSLEGAPWSVLPDDGQRFYADPFVFARDGRTFVFVEDYPYAIGRGLVSVAELLPDGSLTPPRTVLDEPWHLSYPQVFARDGEVWMVPETSGEQKLILYRADRFPDRWMREAVLIEGAEISDATLLERDGRLWLIAAGRDGYGSASDMMVAYSATEVHGPWTPHRRNPVLIDCRRARPGGGFFESGGRLYLPVQDGSIRYGGGLGFAELLQLDDEAVRFGPPRPVAGGSTWPADGLHTYNRAGGLEVVDGFAELRR